MKKKLFTTLSLFALLNISLFASTTIIHSSYYDDGPSPLFNDIYSSLMLTGYVTQPVDSASSQDFSSDYGVNFNGSVFFMQSPVGAYYSIDLIPTESSNTYFVDGMIGLAIRTNSNTLQESYINIGPVISVYTQDDTVINPYTLVYWGAGVNAGYRFSSPSIRSFSADIGATVKALWYDSETSIIGSYSSTPKDFRYTASGYVGFTYRWFAPDWSDDDMNVILAL